MTTPTTPTRPLTLTVNGTRRQLQADDRELLLDVLREQLGLRGSHAGCRNGDCGACTVRLDGRIVKSCLVLAATVDGAEITTVEGLGTRERLSAIQQAFWAADGFQCGFCLPGHLFAAEDLLAHTADPTEAEIRHALQGNLCRCTGYQKMVEAIRAAAEDATD
jgi:aerobic carbon-monoxide dehydrogenase small subunit